MTQSIFSGVRDKSYPFTFNASLYLPVIVGGIPSDPKIAEGWIRSKVQGPESRIQELIAQTVIERKVSTDEAVEIVNKMKNLNGFKRTPEGHLYIEGRYVKAALKEAVGVAVGAKKISQTGWGVTRKWLSNFLPEHVFVVENRLTLLDKEGNPFTEPTEILQNFPHTHHGSSIQYQEAVRDVTINFTVVSDWNFSDHDWEMIWTTGEFNGLGASRSQGYGTYAVTRWEKTVNKEAMKRFDDPKKETTKK